jgi:hypothetical protein
MIKFGGEIKIYSISAFKSIELVIDDMIKLNSETLCLRKKDILEFCEFSINNNNSGFSNSEIQFHVLKNEYDEFYSVEDEIEDLNFENVNLVKEKLTSTNQKIVLKIKTETLNNYKLCLVFSVALVNYVKGIVDLIVYPNDEIISINKKFVSDDWKDFIFQKLVK